MNPPSAPSVNTPLTRKLVQLVDLSPEAVTVLQDLQSKTRLVHRNREIVTQGRQYDVLFVMIRGISIRYRVLHDGGLFFERALYPISALTDVVVAPISFAVMIDLFARHPHLAAATFWSLSSEAAIYSERLTDIGRRTALERVAHFLLELLIRFQLIGLADECSFPMPLTQVFIKDVETLSALGDFEKSYLSRFRVPHPFAAGIGPAVLL